MTASWNQLSDTDATMAEDRLMVSKSAHQAYLNDHKQRLHNEIEATTRKLELEKRRLNKLEEDVSRIRQEHEEKALKPQPQAKQLQGPSIRKLEHRLEKKILELNALGHENQETRARIDAMRRERKQTNHVFKKLSEDIKENALEVAQLQKETDAARRDMEERSHRANALRKQLESERRQFKESAQELQKKLKQSEQEELMQRIKMVKESVDQSEQDRKSKMQSLKADEEEKFNAPSVMRRILKLAFLNAIQRRHIRQHQKNIEVFEQAFATIKSTTGISDIEEIVKIFVGLEQKNFSLLTYVNTLNREIESFEKQNRELEEQLKTQKRLAEDSEQKRNTALTDLKTQIESTQGITEENQLQVAQQGEILERCKPVIQSIVKKIDIENRGFGGMPAPEFGQENVTAWLTYLEKTLTQWKDFLPDVKDARHSKVPSKNYKYTVGNEVLTLQSKKHQHVPLIRPGDLPSAAAAFQEQGAQSARAPVGGRLEEDSSDEEDDLQSHPWTRQELRDKAVKWVAKKRHNRRAEQPTGGLTQSAPGPGDGQQTQRPDADVAGAGAVSGAAAGAGETGNEELDFNRMIEKDKDSDDSDKGSDDSDLDDDIGPTDEEINEIFLKRYKMSKEDLQGMADKMGIQLNNLCYLKQEFDAYDDDRSGYIDVKELKGLLEKLGEELSNEELDQAFRELDSDGSGEIEFFEFVEWFTSED